MDKVFEIVKNIGEWLEIGKNVKEWYGYHSGLEESMKNLKRKMEYLSAQENDINKQISSAEHRPWKKRKAEVQVWLRDEQQMKNEVQRLEQEVVGKRNLFSRVQLGKCIIENIQEVEKLQEMGRAFDGLVVDDFPTGGILMPPTKDFVESTEARNMERVWECLMKEDVRQIGVYGMGGIGKTTIMKHIHNRILKETIRARELYAAILSKFSGQEHTYLSYDETTNITQQGMYIDFFNSISPPGMPPHHLVLKKNAPILLLRNINPSKGLYNGTRLICKEFNTNVIKAEIAVGERK